MTNGKYDVSDTIDQLSSRVMELEEQFRLAQIRAADSEDRVQELKKERHELYRLADDFLVIKRGKCGHLVNEGYICLVCGSDPTE